MTGIGGCLVKTVLSVFTTVVIVLGAAPMTYVLDDNCGNSVSFSDSMVLTARDLEMGSCNFVIQCNSGNNRILLNFLHFDLIDNCTVSKLSIVDDLGKIIAGPLCSDDLNTTVYRTMGQVAQFQYSTANKDMAGRNFTVLLTSFNEGVDGKCAPFEFQCMNKMCISKDLVCNTYDDCSDNSDETSCDSPTPSGSHTGLILGLSLPATFMVIVVIVVVVVKYRKRLQYQGLTYSI